TARPPPHRRWRPDRQIPAGPREAGPPRIRRPPTPRRPGHRPGAGVAPGGTRSSAGPPARRAVDPARAPGAGQPPEGGGEGVGHVTRSGRRGEPEPRLDTARDLPLRGRARQGTPPL